MAEDLREMWRAADPVQVGERLRAARRNARLTQGELGQGLAPTDYVSRLESGSRRGDLELLSKLAAKIGLDVRELLRPTEEPSVEDRLVRVKVDYAELHLASGGTDEAEECLNSISGVAERDLTPPEVREVTRVRAGIAEARGRFREAIDLGEQLAAGPTRDLRWVTDLVALSRCYRESGDLSGAIAVGSRAEEEITRVGLAGSAEAIQLTLTVASAHSDRGELAVAARMCRRAARLADELGSDVALASCYWNASVFEYEQGRIAEAVPLARRALDVFERSSDTRNVGRLRGTLGVFLMRLDPPDLDEAIQVLEQSKTELEASGVSPPDLARSSWALADAHFRRGDTDRAEDLLDDAERLLGEDQVSIVHASVDVLRGQILFSRGRLDDARDAYVSGVHRLSALGADRSAGELWFELANLFDQVGDTESALVAYKSAAASAGLADRARIGGHVNPTVSTDAHELR